MGDGGGAAARAVAVRAVALDTRFTNTYPFGIMTAQRMRDAQPTSRSRRPRPTFGGGFPVPADSR